MKTRCPACGAVASLEVLLTHDDARSLMVALAGISDELAKAALRYLGLFRPGERDLSWARAAKLLGELVPLIQAGEITRKRQSYPAPREAWVWAFNRVIEARDSGKLTPPLTSHGFLLENLTFWTPDKTAGASLAPAADTALSGSLNPQQQTTASSTLQAAAAGEKFKR
ncbi:hypothetical protein H9Q10_05600 [Eikenella sp. S3360]|uniref:DUF2752 domain-containing protein n=1 Tax=Eikenella glucosivorans TaxID=2766967 RepID=A0ABS0NA22_9NEIS|nr:hypothetical protein [Eikenella glucosivorans]MBH5329141.1 hypothetical protein [Eikenella glucosivorans]